MSGIWPGWAKGLDPITPRFPEISYKCVSNPRCLHASLEIILIIHIAIVEYVGKKGINQADSKLHLHV